LLAADAVSCSALLLSWLSGLVVSMKAFDSVVPTCYKINHQNGSYNDALFPLLFCVLRQSERENLGSTQCPQLVTGLHRVDRGVCNGCLIGWSKGEETHPDPAVDWCI
jgi:hypothetical protein